MLIFIMKLILFFEIQTGKKMTKGKINLKDQVKEVCREMRRNQTLEEAGLWKYLRNRRFNNYKFLRQYPVIFEVYGNIPSFYVVDFYCAEKKLIIEIDGKIHLKQKEYDMDRTDILKELGYEILRIKNEEFTNISRVLKKIEDKIKSIPSQK
jgi:very-short-patch-repair endonuclease